jgi:hypothetical protein
VAKVGRAHLAVKAIAKEAITAVKSAPDKAAVLKARKMYKARVVDLLNDLAPELDKLREVVLFLRRLPSLDPSLFTVVVAGAPNVGKSSFVRCVSTAKPEVAEYPFTTKQIHLGHIILRGDKIQVVDTPGLLDRPLSERNAIERQAVLAPPPPGRRHPLPSGPHPPRRLWSGDAAQPLQGDYDELPSAHRRCDYAPASSSPRRLKSRRLTAKAQRS